MDALQAAAGRQESRFVPEDSGASAILIHSSPEIGVFLGLRMLVKQADGKMAFEY
jgi:hypothetical protein